MSAIETVLSRLDGVARQGDQWIALCPAHDDHHPSLRIKEAEDGRVLLHCLSHECAFEAIMRAAGLDPGDAFPEQDRSQRPKEVGRVFYDYHDEHGALAYQVIRIQYDNGSKSFRQRVPDATQPDGWKYERIGTLNYLYHLPDILTLPPESTVVVVEGEKDADRLRAMGFNATTCSGGANAWNWAYAKWLRGFHIVVLPDNDPPGRQFADYVKESCELTAASVQVVELPDLPEKGDVSDWLDAGHDGEALVSLFTRGTLVCSARTNKEERFHDVFRVRSAREFAEETDAEIGWVVDRYVALGALTKIDGAPKAAGKTTFLLRMIAAVLDGADFLDRSTMKTPVFMLSEQSGSSLRVALEESGLLDREDFYFSTTADIAALDWGVVVAGAFQSAAQRGCKLVIFDTLTACAHVAGEQENDAGTARVIIDAIVQQMAKWECAVVLVFHDRKSGGEVGESGRGSSAYAGAVDIIMQLTRAGTEPNTRKIAALSRYPDTPQEEFIKLEPEGYQLIGDRQDVAQDAVGKALLEVLPASDVSAVPVVDLTAGGVTTQVGLISLLRDAGTKTSRRTVESVLHDWLRDDRVRRKGEGKRHSPYRYWLPRDPVSFVGEAEHRGSDGEPRNYEIWDAEQQRRFWSGEWDGS